VTAQPEKSAEKQDGRSASTERPARRIETTLRYIEQRRERHHDASDPRAHWRLHRTCNGANRQSQDAQGSVKRCLKGLLPAASIVYRKQGHYAS
jgi:hypothetical protein